MVYVVTKPKNKIRYHRVDKENVFSFSPEVMEKYNIQAGDEFNVKYKESNTLLLRWMGCDAAK